MKIALFLAGLAGAYAQTPCVDALTAIATQANLDKIAKLQAPTTQETLADYCTNDAADLGIAVDNVLTACQAEAATLGLAVKEISAVLTLAKALPCIEGPNGGYAWARFAPLVPIDEAEARILAAVNSNDFNSLLSYWVDFSSRITHTILEQVCAEDGGDDFRAMVNAIASEIGRLLPTGTLSADEQALADGYIAIFRRYAAQIVGACDKPEPEDPADEGPNEYCRVTYDSTFAVSETNPLGTYTTGTDFCNGGGIVDPCTTTIVAGTQAFPDAQIPTGDINYISATSLMAACEPVKEETAKLAGYRITANVKVNNIQNFREEYLNYIQSSTAYDFGFFAELITITEWKQEATSLTFTAVIEITDLEDGTLERLTYLVNQVKARMAGGQSVLPLLEANVQQFLATGADSISIDPSSTAKVERIDENGDTMGPGVMGVASAAVVGSALACAL